MARVSDGSSDRCGAPAPIARTACGTSGDKGGLIGWEDAANRCRRAERSTDEYAEHAERTGAAGEAGARAWPGRADSAGPDAAWTGADASADAAAHTSANTEAARAAPDAAEPARPVAR